MKEIWEKKMKEQGPYGVLAGCSHNEVKEEKKVRGTISVLEEYLHFFKQKGVVLDAGIGPLANFSIELSKRGYKVTGIDISKTIVNFAKSVIKKKNIKNIKVLERDITDLKFYNKFDAVFCRGTFGHIPSYLSLKALKNFNRCLKKEGVVFLEFWIKREETFYDLLSGFRYFLGRKTKKIIGMPAFKTTTSSYTENEIKDMLKRSGFKIISKKKTILFA